MGYVERYGKPFRQTKVVLIDASYHALPVEHMEGFGMEPGQELAAAAAGQTMPVKRAMRYSQLRNPRSNREGWQTLEQLISHTASFTVAAR